MLETSRPLKDKTMVQCHIGEGNKDTQSQVPRSSSIFYKALNKHLFTVRYKLIILFIKQTKESLIIYRILKKINIHQAKVQLINAK